jgi:hypothetical protein
MMLPKMPSQPTSTETRLDNVLAYMTLAITTLNELSDSFGTPFLQAISSTTLSLVTQVQVAGFGIPIRVLLKLDYLRMSNNTRTNVPS